MDPYLQRLTKIATSTLGHFLDEGFPDIEIQPVHRPVRLAGRAFTIDAPPRDNAVYRRALSVAKPGDVLVIHRHGDRRHASFGGLLGLAAKNHGIAGVVLDGPMTDFDELLELGLPIFARGVTPLTTRRLDAGGTYGRRVQCGGVLVSPGDYVLGDNDGVLFVPADRIASVVDRGEAYARREAETRAWLLAGKTLAEIDALRAP
ncbi:MAG: RraA family protein [Armatimonadetes bacterium]|nr:RraA family protein [Armatimonadota bacterium]